MSGSSAHFRICWAAGLALAVFMGRGLYHILEGLASGAAGLLIAVLAFRIHLAPSGLLLALACVLLISFTSSGLGSCWAASPGGTRLLDDHLHCPWRLTSW
jgi:hypothetical protein